MDNYVKKPFPCSMLDIRGLERWLDEMALQGLFLDRISYHNDQALFLPGEPRAVRYRLDPVGKNWNDVERKELFAQAGWTFVDAFPRYFYVFSCDDPEVPELYTDPQSMAEAMKYPLRRTRNDLLLIPAMLGGLLLLFLLYPGPEQLLTQLLLQENPRKKWYYLFLAISLTVCTVISVVQFLRLRQDYRALSQGLSPRPRRRWNRPRYLAVLLGTLLSLNFLQFWARAYDQPIYSLDGLSFSRPWPTVVQLDETGGVSPDGSVPQGYAYLNSSYFVPIQEEVEQSTDSAGGSPNRHSLLTTRYASARSEQVAEFLFNAFKHEALKSLNRQANTDFRYGFQTVTQVGEFEPLSHPKLDQAEVAAFRRGSSDGFLLALRSGDQVLIAEYSGPGVLGPCVDLYADILNNP